MPLVTGSATVDRRWRGGLLTIRRQPDCIYADAGPAFISERLCGFLLLVEIRISYFKPGA